MIESSLGRDDVCTGCQLAQCDESQPIRLRGTQMINREIKLRKVTSLM